MKIDILSRTELRQYSNLTTGSIKIDAVRRLVSHNQLWVVTSRSPAKLECRR
jgi:hypothetical protein